MSRKALPYGGPQGDACGSERYGSKSIILIVSVIHRARTAAGRAIMFCGQDAAEADNQATAKGELVSGLIGVDPAASVISIVIGAPCRADR